MSDNKMPEGVFNLLDEIWVESEIVETAEMLHGKWTSEIYVNRQKPYIKKDLVNLKFESVPISEIEALIEKWEVRSDKHNRNNEWDNGAYKAIDNCIDEIQNLISKGSA